MINEDQIEPKLDYNTKDIFSYIFRNGEITKFNLGLLLDKNLTSVNRILAPLVEDSLIIPLKKGSSTGGRKPIIYDINPNRYYIGCIDISSSYYEVGIIDLKMNMLKVYNKKIHPDELASDVLKDIILILKTQIKELDLNKSNFLGIGVSVFASINNDTGQLIRPLFMFPHDSWLEINIFDTLKSQFDVPIEITKGTNAATMLEYLFGVGKGNSKFINILCAMNIRSAVIYDGQIINNTPYCEDSFGHMVVDFDGKKCFCGKYGCLARYATIPSIVELFKAGLKIGKKSNVSVDIDDITFDIICDAVDNNDPLAIEVITEAATIMGIALSNYINLFSPDVVALSGLIIKRCNLFYEHAIKTALKESALIHHEKTVKFVSKSSFNNSITTGAGLMLIERMLSSNSNNFF